MWIQIDDDQAKALLAVSNEDPIVKYFQERIRHYSDLNGKIEEAFREAAQNHTSDGDLEVDEDAVVSMGADPGAYVMAWIWVTNEEAGFDSEEGSEDLEEVEAMQAKVENGE